MYKSLPPQERAQAVIRAQNYGEAGAIEFFGGQYGLTAVISGHSQYYLWGPRGLQRRPADLCWRQLRLGRTLVHTLPDLAARFSAPWLQPFEDNIPIMICPGIRKPLAEIWRQSKYYE